MWYVGSKCGLDMKIQNEVQVDSDPQDANLSDR